MPVFKAFYKIIRQSKSSILLYFFIFLLLSFLIPNLLNDSGDNSFESTKVPVTVQDKDGKQLGKGLTHFLGKSHTLVDLPYDKERLCDELFYGNIDYILIIPEGFEKSFQGNSKIELKKIAKDNSAEASYLDQQLNQYLKLTKVYLNSGYDMKTALAQAEKNVSVKADVMLQNNTKASTANSNLFGFYQYIPYLLTAIITLVMGTALMKLDNGPTKKRSFCSSMPLFQRNVQLILGCITFCLFTWFIFIAVILVQNRDTAFGPSGLLLLINSFVYSIVALSLGYLVGTISTSSSFLSFISNILALGFSFLGGVFVPTEFLSESVLNISKFLPSYWYIKVMEYGKNVESTSDFFQESIYKGIGIQLLFALAVFAVALLITKYKQRGRQIVKL